MDILDVQRAIWYGEKWKKSDPQSTSARYNLAGAYIHKNEYERAENLLEQILAVDSTHIPALNQLARLYRRSDRYRDALTQYEKLIQVDTTRGYYPRMAAEMAYLTAQFDRAFYYYQKSLKINSNDPSSLSGLARISIDAGAFDQADSLLSKALSADSTNFAIRLLYSKSAYLQENYALVDELLNQDVLLEKKSTQGLQYLGLSRYYLGEYMGSMKVLTALINLDSELHYPHYYIGLCYLALGEKEYAEVQFRQAVNKSLSPNLPIYYEQLGLTQQELDNHQSAIDNLIMAKKLGSDIELNFHLGVSYDAYFEDKEVALRSYSAYLRDVQELDSLTENSRTRHAKARIDEINRKKHFETGDD